jgi:hypothetical protein
MIVGTIRAYQIKDEEVTDVRVFNKPMIDENGDEVGRSLNARVQCVGDSRYVVCEIEIYEEERATRWIESFNRAREK